MILRSILYNIFRKKIAIKLEKIFDNIDMSVGYMFILKFE